MKRITLLVSAILLFAVPAIAADIQINRPTEVGCTKVIGITATGDSYWLDARGRPMVVTFESDVTGAATSLTVTVQHCVSNEGDFDTNRCEDYTWLDNAGASSNILTGTGARRGFQWAITGGVLRFTITGSAVGTGELRICAS